MSTTVKVQSVPKITVKPDVVETISVVIKAVGPQGSPGTATGDMTKAVYDPTNANGDAFSMGNMVEAANALVFLDAERSKLAGIQAGAQVNHSAAEIKTRYESNANTNAYTDTEKSKLAAIEEGADVTADNETSHADVLVDSDIGVTVASVSHDHSGVYEPVFSKNTAFNKNFGTGAGQVSEGNHAHAGYEPVDPNILRTDDIGVVIAAESHTHTEADITDLRAYLEAYQVTFELLDANGDVGTGADQLAQGNHTHPRMTVFVEDMDSEAAPNAYVPTSNGTGLVTWQEQAAGYNQAQIEAIVDAQVASTIDTYGYIVIDDAIAMAIALG